LRSTDFTVAVEKPSAGGVATSVTTDYSVLTVDARTNGIIFRSARTYLISKSLIITEYFVKQIHAVQ